MSERRLHIWMPTVATGTGAEVYSKRLTEGLRNRGHRVDLELFPFLFQFLPWLIPSRAPEGCDVIIANSWNAAALKRRDIPLVTVVHHVVHSDEAALNKSFAQKIFHRSFVMPLERMAIARSNLVVTPSLATAREVESVFGFTSAQAILNGIDVHLLRPNQTSQPRHPGPVRLLFVGKPSRRKGFDIVARLMEVMGNEASLTIAGPAPEPGLPFVKAHWEGRVSDDRLRDLYRSSDFLLFPSRLEGFGYVAAEAMACGTPVICLAGGAVEEIVAPPQGGILLDPTSPGAARHAILNLVADEAKMDSLRKSARERARLFSTDRWIDSFEYALAAVIS